MLSTFIDEAQDFYTPQTITARELGDGLAQLVWESFSDFFTTEDEEFPLPQINVFSEDEKPSGRASEEALIFFMWAYTRGAQMAFLGQVPDERLRTGLDALHQAVFEDMMEHGTPESQLPTFERRVINRYAEYHQAATESDHRLGEVASRRLIGREISDSLSSALSERAIAIVNPLKDFLDGIKLIDS